MLLHAHLQWSASPDANMPRIPAVASSWVAKLALFNHPEYIPPSSTRRLARIWYPVADLLVPGGRSSVGGVARHPWVSSHWKSPGAKGPLPGMLVKEYESSRAVCRGVGYARV